MRGNLQQTQVAQQLISQRVRGGSVVLVIVSIFDGDRCYSRVNIVR